MLKLDDFHVKVYCMSLEESVALGGKLMEKYGVKESVAKILNAIRDKQALDATTIPGTVVPLISAETKEELDRASSHAADWNWISLKDAETLEQRYTKGFNEFKVAFKQWMSWHIRVAKLTSSQPIPPDMGVEFEKDAGIDLSSLTNFQPNDMA